MSAPQQPHSDHWTPVGAAYPGPTDMPPMPPEPPHRPPTRQLVWALVAFVLIIVVALGGFFVGSHWVSKQEQHRDDQGHVFPAGVGTAPLGEMTVTFSVPEGAGFLSREGSSATVAKLPQISGNQFTPISALYTGRTSTDPATVSRRDTVVLGQYETCNSRLWSGASPIELQFGSTNGLELTAYQTTTSDGASTYIIPIPTGATSCIPFVVQVGKSYSSWFGTNFVQGGASLG